jgi:tetratricopeptide (TPR) repeat protein
MRLALAIMLLCLAGCVSPNEERWRLFNEDGIQLFSKGNYADALDSFDYALTMHPGDPVLIYNNAQCYDRLGKYQRAEELYLYVLQRDPKHGDSRLALVSLKNRTNRIAEANEQIQDWLRQEPTLADPYVADAWRLRQEKQYAQAMARVEQALSLEPHNRRALTEMAILLEIQGMPERALALYEWILQHDPNQLEIAERREQLRAKGVQPPPPKVSPLGF